MKITNLKIKNFGKICNIDIGFPKNGIMEIQGKNGSGKTTLIRAIFCALAGKCEKDMIQQGKEKSLIDLETDQYFISLTVTEKSEILKVEDKNKPGFQCRSPKTLLKTLLSKVSFSPDEFLRSNPKIQKELLLKIIDIPFDEKFFLEKQCNNRINFVTGKNVLEKINSAYSQLFERRTIANRDKKQAKAVHDSLFDVSEIKKIDIIEITSRHSALMEQQEKNNDIDVFIQGQNQKILNIESEKEILIEEKKRIENRLLQIEHDRSAMQISIVDMKKYFDINTIKSLQNIKNQIENISEINKKAEQYKAKQDAFSKFDEIDRDTIKITGCLEEIKKYAIDILGKVDFPVEGLGFQRGEVSYNNIAFSKCCGSEQLILSLYISLALIPDQGIRAIFFLDPPQLDENSKRIIEDFAIKNDVQVFMPSVIEGIENITVVFKGEKL